MAQDKWDPQQIEEMPSNLLRQAVHDQLLEPGPYRASARHDGTNLGHVMGRAVQEGSGHQKQNPSFFIKHDSC